MRIYLDHAATTPVDPQVIAAMEPWLGSEFGNPSSLYSEGRKAREAIDEAREVVSRSLGCLFGEVVFTSSGTEAANLGILGPALANTDSRRRRILMGAAEHHCVLHTRPLLERLGYTVEVLPVDRSARIRLDELDLRLRDDVFMVAAMHVNNEVGTIQDVAAIAEKAHRVGALLFVDAVQTYLTACAPVTVAGLGADYLSIAAHKFHGPKGIGALYAKAGAPLNPVTVGGGQEREVRAGTENTAAIVGLAAAIRVSNPEEDDQAKRTARDAFLTRLAADGGATWVETVPREGVLSGHAHLRFPGASAESLLILLDRLGLSASSGAACSSGSLEPSHVLLACGYTQVEAAEGLRFTFGRLSTVSEAQLAADLVLQAATQVLAA